VLKPGGHLLAFGGSRTWHRIAVAIEDAGFDVRDSIAWLYGSGFPKSLDISKAIDKAAGAEREVVGYRDPNGSGVAGDAARDNSGSHIWSGELRSNQPITDEAKKWQGWGTALKPAFEPIVVARKPLVGTVAANVLLWGVGGLNIDGSRIGTTETWNRPPQSKNEIYGKFEPVSTESNAQGRWPANIILDEHTAGLLDEQSGQVKGNPGAKQTTDFRFMNDVDGKQKLIQGDRTDVGGASRFFYVAKASKKDRNEGLEDLPDVHPSEVTGRKEGSAGASNGGYSGMTETPRKNIHPTVKPTALMEYLVKLVTPPGGTVLDPFTGSGSTGKAALLNGFKFIGIELTADYLPIIEGRLKHAAETYANQATEEANKEQETLF
jgi:site-specific DNA-methyltransferase (adenine-specific)